ncbi:cutinase family protein [Gryllotalpicola ginsengisoli]|uniref:cutinase family protein n=1 Tax=Gryllotalpicola ginsengisoli TaxID=444608 RepID=UPI0009D730A1|nr:cutinase family protein [Gryllotalpicola ginsengisoli]
MRVTRLLAAASAALLACAGALVAGPPAIAAPSPDAAAPVSGTAPPDCADFEFIAARGSGEDNSTPAATRYTTGNLGMGGELHDVYERIEHTASAQGVTVAAYGVPYPAIGVDVLSTGALFGDTAAAYLKSAELGAHAAAAEIERVHRECPDTGIIVGGYSQGAEVIVDAVNETTAAARESLRAAVFFGSTYFTASATAHDYGNYDPDLDGYLVHTGGDLGGPSTPSGENWADAFGDTPIFDYCHNGDPICGLVDDRTIDGVDYPVRDFAHIVTASADDDGHPSIFSQHTTYLRGDTLNAAQYLRQAMGLPIYSSGDAPTATITADGSAEVGAPARFNAGGTLSDPADPVVSYHWVIDAGTADARDLYTADPVLTTTFDERGEHTVRVSVTTTSGATSGASVNVQVVATPVISPSAPTQVKGESGDGTATLSWPVVDGAAFYAVRDGPGKLLAAFTPLTPGQDTVSWTDTGLKNGSRHDYRVYAVNSVGASDASRQVTVTPHARDTDSDADGDRPLALPVPRTTLVDPELAWAVGLGLIVAVLVVTLVAGRSGGPGRPGRR